jgi:hypothetical protein
MNAPEPNATVLVPPARVSLKLQCYGFGTELRVRVSPDEAPAGGFDLFEAALRRAHTLLPTRTVYPPGGDATEHAEMAWITLTDRAGNEATLEDVHLRGVEWLKPLVVAIELLPPW